MKLELSELRIKLDQQAEKIISGLKDRSRYTLNKGVFTEPFYDKKSWFEYRLLGEQSLDSEFGRYEFEDQHPVFFSRAQLAKPKTNRLRAAVGLVPADIDMSAKVVGIYQKLLEKICEQGENPQFYGETVKTDVNNVLALYERIVGLGQKVAEAKVQEYPALFCLDENCIREKLSDSTREEKVIKQAVEIAQRYNLPNSLAMNDFFREIIDLTLDVEVNYVIQAGEKEKRKPRVPAGFGQVASVSATNARGWGSA
jgi:chorismate mutase